MIVFRPLMAGFEVSAGVDLSLPSAPAAPKPPTDLTFALDLGGGSSAISSPRRAFSTQARSGPLVVQRSSMLSKLAAASATGRGGSTPEPMAPPIFERASAAPAEPARPLPLVPIALGLAAAAAVAFVVLRKKRR